MDEDEEYATRPLPIDGERRSDGETSGLGASPGGQGVDMWYSVASLSALVGCVTAAHQASVYKFPHNTHTEHNAPTLSAPESRQIFSEIFKVTRYHKLGFIGQQSRVLDTMNMDDDMETLTDGGLWSRQSGSVVLNVAGVTDAKHIFPESKPLYHITDSPPSDAYSDLLLRLLGQAEDMRSERLEKVYANSRGGGLYLSPPLKVLFDLPQTHGPSMARFEEFYGADVARHFDIKVPEDRAFIAELSALESFIDALSRVSVPLQQQFAAGHIVGLESLYYKYGAHSEKYTAGARAMHMTLSSLHQRLTELQDSRLFVSLLPPVQRSKKSSILKRWEENEAAFGDIHAAPSLEGFGRGGLSGLSSQASVLRRADKVSYNGCYSSQDACESDTDSCSGHGSCQKYLDQEDCYQCACTPTVKNSTTGSGHKTTVWAGPSCAKKDVSFEFQVFFWFNITMIATVWWSVKMLYSVEIGSGGVLAATGYVNKGSSAN